VDNKLDFTSLKNAVASFKSVVRVYYSLKDNGEEERAALRAGVIQNFEFSFELSWKYIKRWIEMNDDPLSVDGVTRRELFRRAAENRLIVDVEKWFQFYQDRNRTSHIYDENVAEEVLATAFDALPYFEDLLKCLEAKQ